ncbi:MAG: hypothetical protein ACLUI7_02275 [Coprococcus sp.]
MREMLNPTSAIAGMGLGSSGTDHGRTFLWRIRGASSDMYLLKQHWRHYRSC